MELLIIVVFYQMKKLILLLGMSGLLKHRGPDDSNYFKIDDNVLLGHTRLSIIDFFRGSQPMSNENEDIWVNSMVIYNYVELKKIY